MEETIYPEKWVKPEIEELGNAKDLVAAVNEFGGGDNLLFSLLLPS